MGYPPRALADMTIPVRRRDTDRIIADLQDIVAKLSERVAVLEGVVK